jgi:hypothetical protein
MFCGGEEMTTIQLSLPDEISQMIDTSEQSTEVFVLKAVEEKLVRDKARVDLSKTGINETEASVQRHAFAAFAEDWDDAGMDEYDRL